MKINIILLYLFFSFCFLRPRLVCLLFFFFLRERETLPVLTDVQQERSLTLGGREGKYMYKDPPFHKKDLFLFVVYFLESCLSFFILFASGLLFIQHLYKVRCLTRLCPLSWTSPPNRQQRAKVDFLFLFFEKQKEKKKKRFLWICRSMEVCVCLGRFPPF